MVVMSSFRKYFFSEGQTTQAPSLTGGRVLPETKKSVSLS
jgi:hypothetical protein